MIVMELTPLGELRQYLLQNADVLRKTRQCMAYCWQVASALEYLSAKGCVHRDVAARNVLVSTPLIVKV